MLAAGGGIAMLPDFIAETELASGALVRILADWSLPQVFLHLLSPPSRLRPARVRALSDPLAQTLKASCAGRDSWIDRQRVAWGKSVAVRVTLGGSRDIK